MTDSTQTAPLSGLRAAPAMRYLRAAAGSPSILLMLLTGALGLLAFTAAWRGLWSLWATDPLRSAGMLVPLAAAMLAVRAYRRADRRDWHGSWLGWPLLLATLALGLLGNPSLELAVALPNRAASVNLLTTGILLSGYVSGWVLLFGGTRAWRALAFPILFLMLVNPLPGAFSSLLDLPLQHIGAETARGFAALIGVPVSEGTLKMMFSPNLGMFIAPGCDGLRGVVALGLLALVLGHLHRLRPLRWLVFVLGAMLLAYVFNLLRLCAVVIYYWFAVRFDWLGAYGTEADYLIGGVLFCGAVAFLLGVPRWMAARAAAARGAATESTAESPAEAKPAVAQRFASRPAPGSESRARRTAPHRLGVLLPVVLIAAGCGLYTNSDLWQTSGLIDPALAEVVLLPASIDGATPMKSWTNPRPSGPIEQGTLYAAAGLGAAGQIQLDFYRNNTRPHRGIACYLTQGESLVSEKLRNVMTASGVVMFDVALLRSQNQLRLAATTECTAAGCSEQLLRPDRAFGLRWVPGNRMFSPAPSVVPASVMLRRELPDNADAQAVAHATRELEAQFARIAPQLDFAPARRLAVLQSAAHGRVP